MNILYISKLTGQKWTGPNESVPNQIAAQSKYDDVFWYNINQVKKQEWLQKVECNNLSDYNNLSLDSLPEPFNKPDLIVFQGVYQYPFNKLIFEIWKKKIPYIVIPRSSLTAKAQKQKSIKKKLFNTLFFNRFLKRAIAIQYLTESEYLDSGDKWNANKLIIPNGVSYKSNTKVYKNNTNKLTGVYIGRIDTYQKGLDLLVHACTKIKDNMIAKKCVIKLYGRDQKNSKEKLNKLIITKGLEDIITIHEGVFDLEKEKVLLEADFFLMTSRFEGHPMGLIEALSYGLPCLVTNGTNMLCEIKEQDAGWVSGDSPKEISETLDKVIMEQNLYKRKSSQALELSKKYNWDHLAKQTNIEYTNLMKGK